MFFFYWVIKTTELILAMNPTFTTFTTPQHTWYMAFLSCVFKNENNAVKALHIVHFLILSHKIHYDTFVSFYKVRIHPCNLIHRTIVFFRVFKFTVFDLCVLCRTFFRSVVSGTFIGWRSTVTHRQYKVKHNAGHFLGYRVFLIGSLCSLIYFFVTQKL